jgi:cation diffusion facilitator CzcD-associated flavoprotein CzcO
MLHRAGYDEVTVFERGERLGGVWHYNTSVPLPPAVGGDERGLGSAVRKASIAACEGSRIGFDHARVRLSGRAL